MSPKLGCEVSPDIFGRSVDGGGMSPKCRLSTCATHFGRSVDGGGMSPISTNQAQRRIFGRSVDGGGISLTILLTSAKWSLDGMLKAEIFFLIHSKRLPL